MFDYVYLNPILEKEHSKAAHVVTVCWIYSAKKSTFAGGSHSCLFDRFGKQQTVLDYVAGLTDIGAINLFNKYFVPKDLR
jgi:dGTPase